MMDNNMLSDGVHENAKKMFTDDIYWSQPGFRGPFGANYGLQGYFEFKEWRSLNINVNPMIFLEQNKRTNFDWYDLDTNRISEFFSQHGTFIDVLSPDLLEIIKATYGNSLSENAMQQMITSVGANAGPQYLTEQDNLIIATGFGQFVLEGKIDAELLILTRIALRRQLLDIVIQNLPDIQAQESRRYELTKMLEDISG